jgi:hypothetical protein|tara:strand:- start:544 stop:951 length:408 start_codon:yes stop_codon:yes gene_type:complete
MKELFEQEIKEAESMGERAAERDMEWIKKLSKKIERQAIVLSNSLIDKERSWKKTAKILNEYKIRHVMDTRRIVTRRMEKALLDGNAQAAVVLNCFKETVSFGDCQVGLAFACYMSLVTNRELSVEAIGPVCNRK